ncbi:hypothetical protein [Anaplasma platys]|uniref:hypothetical protein n=1 Tax=Anaplasma platys TaxID=949 RepID=UPI00145F1B07|nr:hypothetical protein [Anaplasma platys]
MSAIAYFYLRLTKHFQADRVLKILLSQVYEQVPTSAALPYTYVNLDLVEDIRTYGDLAHRIKVSCHTFCNNLSEMLEIVEELRSCIHSFLRKRTYVTLADMHYKIICIPSGSFQSVIHIEVLSRDFSED